MHFHYYPLFDLRINEKEGLDWPLGSSSCQRISSINHSLSSKSIDLHPSGPRIYSPLSLLVPIALSPSVFLCQKQSETRAVPNLLLLWSAQTCKEQDRLLLLNSLSISGAMAALRRQVVLLAPLLAAVFVLGSAFDERFSPLFGEANMEQSADGRTVRLTLNRYSGSGFISSDYYHHGFFSANVRLPKDHTAGVVVAFYLSNGDVFDKDHDELDFEFLGNRRRHEWRLQTNVYGNGSTDRGREERYLMPFDPTAGDHRFSILWSSRVVIFYVDGVAIREVPRSPEMGGDYPSKPMAVYATIWDGSTWATDNGRYKVNYKRGPFTAEFSDLVIRGCPVSQQKMEKNNLLLQLHKNEHHRDRCAGAEFELMTADYAIMTARKRMEMRRWRQRQMLYTVCYDTNRYPQPFPECDVNAAERQKFWEWGESKVVRPRSGSSRRRTPTPALVSLQQAD